MALKCRPGRLTSAPDLKGTEWLEADEDELLILAKKVSPAIRERVLERPDVFSKLAQLDDAMLDRVMPLRQMRKSGSRFSTSSSYSDAVLPRWTFFGEERTEQDTCLSILVQMLSLLGNRP